jgi:alkanesulfonate monooxygenase SsuD/methylene tetrahydromethanopterin reductase-like flavin-dependent oxidoreductase (luciferase family)
VVKRYGILGHLAGGRLILGAGIGSLAAEFDVHRRGEPGLLSGGRWT